jgi:NTP pyrophosphatase (non-canonical NTP hydrolase)
MDDLSFNEMLAMQLELWEKHKDEWSSLEPKNARNHFLWLIGELGEALEIIKKCGEEQIMGDKDVRAAFTEELVDVQMYFNEILMRYQITGADMSDAYRKKHAKNMKRDYESEESSFISRVSQNLR